jgi:hypothetical protein
MWEPAADSRKGPTMPDWLTLLKDFGLPVCLVIFFILRDKAREERSEKRLTDLETFARHQLVELWEKSNNTLRENTAVILRLERFLEHKGEV